MQKKVVWLKRQHPGRALLMEKACMRLATPASVPLRTSHLVGNRHVCDHQLSHYFH